MNNKTGLELFGLLILVLFILLGIAWVFQVGYHALIVTVTGWERIGYWHAFFLMLFLSIFIGAGVRRSN
ncbi:MAG: hypothetical protein ACXAEN_22945 [Candidatus Thorarchaeota archaeon]